jgi:hypothetical protein
MSQNRHAQDTRTSQDTSTLQDTSTSTVSLKLSPGPMLAALLLAFASSLAAAQDLTPGLIYVCSGEKMFIENCNMRDLFDNASCMVGHPDHVNPNGLMQYTNMTRGALKKLFPTCTQPSAKQVAAAQAFQKRQQDTYDANVQKANDQLKPAAQPATFGQPQKPKTPEERATNRCITSGRLPSACLGNSLLGAFGQMLSSVLPGADKAPTAGPNMAGVFQGAGNWRLDFIDGGVLVNCAYLAPNQEARSPTPVATALPTVKRLWTPSRQTQLPLSAPTLTAAAPSPP